LHPENLEGLRVSFELVSFVLLHTGPYDLLHQYISVHIAPGIALFEISLTGTLIVQTAIRVETENNGNKNHPRPKTEGR
jgi:hypothetical protein